MKTKSLTVITLLAVLALLLSGPAIAQDPQPPPPYPPQKQGLPEGALPWEPKTGKPLGPHQTPDGQWMMSTDDNPSLDATGISPQATGGPDDFGYTWNDSVPFNWIDATAGTNSGLTGDDRFMGPINIGFNFKFYEKVYTQLYFSTNGLVTFSAGASDYSNKGIPNPAPPNNFIAPLWDDLTVGSTYNSGNIYYLQGGTAPNRYFVIEWYNVTRCCSSGATDYKTFEVILHENGDIVMQYLSLSGYLYSATVGIEDDIGVTGLQYLFNSSGLSNNKAVRFYRPGIAARVNVWPLYQGSFTRAGAAESFQLSIRNTGELGEDTYDLTTSSAWPVSLYAANGTTPLTDTDGDGAVDTGSVTQGSTVIIHAKIQTPAGATVGYDNSAAITARSSRDTNKSKTVTIQMAIPAPFAQVYRDDADGAMSLYLVQPAAQVVKKATTNNYYGYEMAVAEAPNGNFVYAWEKYRCLDSNCNNYTYEIEYTLLDRYGKMVRPASRLTDHSGATLRTYDYSPVVAVAPNGRIGVLWYRYLWNPSTYQHNYNLWFAILDSSGSRVYGPVNLTNNNTWGDWDDLNVPRFYDPRIAATSDNRFVLAWEREHQESGGWVSDIYYAARDTNGGVIKDVTRFTFDTPGWDQSYDYPALTKLSGNRVLIAWHQYISNNSNVAYAVLDSGGNVIKPSTTIGADGWSIDAVQLSSGRIVLAWTSWTGTKPQIAFAVLDSASYNVIAINTLNNLAAFTGNEFVSVAADADGNAILTWMDYDYDDRRNLYYALVDGNSNILTPPMIFRTSQAIYPRIVSSYVGYGNTSSSWTMSPDVDGFAAFNTSLFSGSPGGNGAVVVRYANHGATTATGVVLTATLGSGLTYVGDTSGVFANVSGNNVTWSLPDLSLLESRDFTLYIQVPAGAAYGARYPITLTMTSAGPEANPSDNTANAEVMAARQVFLPAEFNLNP